MLSFCNLILLFFNYLGKRSKRYDPQTNRDNIWPTYVWTQMPVGSKLSRMSWEIHESTREVSGNNAKIYNPLYYATILYVFFEIDYIIDFF